MSLIAPFSTMSLPEVFGWLDSSRRAGVLTVRGVGVETVLHVRNGRVDELNTLTLGSLIKSEFGRKARRSCMSFWASG